jgi:AcrR family transcriptional regulator
MNPKQRITKPSKSQVPTPADGSDGVADALLTAAREIFETGGLPALTVRRVTIAAGCTTMQVYSRYNGKNGLVQALFDEGFTALANAQQSVPHSLPAAERVRQLCREYLRIAAEKPSHYALMLGAHSGDFQPAKESGDRAMATLATLIEAVARALPQTPNKDARAKDVAHQILALCHGWAMLSATQLVDGHRADVIDQAIASLLGLDPAPQTQMQTT